MATGLLQRSFWEVQCVSLVTAKLMGEIFLRITNYYVSNYVNQWLKKCVLLQNIIYGGRLGHQSMLMDVEIYHIYYFMYTTQ